MISEKQRRKPKTQLISRSRDIRTIPRLFDLTTGQLVQSQARALVEEVKVKGDNGERKQLVPKLNLTELIPQDRFVVGAPLLSERGTSSTKLDVVAEVQTPSPQKPLERVKTPETKPTSSSSSTCSSIVKSQTSRSVGKSLIYQLQCRLGGQSSNLASTQRRLKSLGLVGSISPLLQGPSELDGFGYLYVYCVKDNLSELKIGRTKNFPAIRIRNTEKTNKKKYMTLETFGCNFHMLLEKAVHSELAEKRIELPEHWDGRTEWFRVEWSIARPVISRLLFAIETQGYR